MASSSSRKRPRGLWKAHVTSPAGKFQERQTIVNSECDTDIDEIDDDDNESISSGSSKRRKFTPPSDISDDEEIYHWHYSRTCSPYPDRVSSWTTRKKVMDTSTTAGSGNQPERETCDYEDWEDLKELFAKAAEAYESADASEALPILRGVIHECHRFLLYYQDPSVLFSTPTAQFIELPETLTPPEGYPKRDWATGPSTAPATSLQQVPQEHKCKCVEVPTAFHALLGTALFLFGNLIAQEPALALEGEPNNPNPYWLAALDVFETGESLPGRISGRGYDAPEDWRMAIVWGRTLVCLADELVTCALERKQPPGGSEVRPEPGPSVLLPITQFPDEPDWPPESPFSAIAARRPPVTRRMSLYSASPNDLMVLAMDQFSRGIFHMPHPQHHHPPVAASGSIATVPPVQPSFSRAKELFTIASEVLLLAEKLEVASERQYWASWADSVFNQMKMEADMDAWRGPITRARGRCWLIVGSAGVDELEATLERGDMDVLNSEEAQEAREGLATAIEFFERAKGSASASSASDPESHEIHPLLAEALLTLANLTPDEKKRDELYARAQAESAEDFNLKGKEDSEDERMDESG